MNWEAIGAVGEVLGALAVVLTLVYLAIQIRQNTSSTRASTYSDTTDGWHNYMQSQSTADIDLLICLATTPSKLTLAEFYRGYYVCRVIFRRMENDYFQFKAGTFDSETWDAYVNSFREDTFKNPALRVMWKLQATHLNPAFYEYMQPQIEEASKSRQVDIRTEFERLLANERGQSNMTINDA